MKTPFLAALTALILLAGTGTSLAETPLDEAMQAMRKAYKKLSADLQAPDESAKASYLSLVDTLKKESAKAAALVPAKAAELPPDQKDAMVKAYEESMQRFETSVATLGQNIQDAKWEEARKSIDVLKQEMQDGHKAFRKKD